eukprot:TRINITY_DN29181_c0_g1_i1.p1 TRINITY_DN29181_c0_g1~~TRINITY_DN29181_c0_g1_i1.p1  ORF type:complete len:1018 (+),score=299.85 TRINITY_DN29181_c0_g1_i1:144-3197(+)
MYGYGYPMGYPGAMPGYAYPNVPPGYGHAAPAAPAAAVLTAADDIDDLSDSPEAGFGYGASKEKEKSKKADKKSSQKSKKSSKKESKESTSKNKESWPEGLAVTGCKDKTVKKIVRGNFTLAGENHGRPYYKREEKFNDLDVMIYFWDSRDGADFCGWWFGPKVGGDQVWAYQPCKDETPPLSGWKVPYDGPVDKNLAIKAQKTKTKPAAEAEAGFAAYPGYPGQPMDAHAYERQMQEYARLQQEEMKRRFEYQRLEDQRRREEAKRIAEETRKRREEERKRREEEAKRQKEIQDKRIREGRAVFTLKKVLQKVASATPENLEELQKELEEAIKTDLEDTGAQKEQIKVEAEKCLEQAKKRVEILNEAKRKAQEKKDEEERQRLALELRAKELMQELSGLLDLAEGGIENLKDACAPLENSEELSLEEVNSFAVLVEESGVGAKALNKAAMDYLVAHGPEMKDPPAVLTGGATAPSEVKDIMTKLLSRMNECVKQTETLLGAARAVRDAAFSRRAALKLKAEHEALFARYDVDKDKALSKEEVIAFAKGEYDLDISTEVVNKIWRCAVDADHSGVVFERLHLLRLKLGTERELQRDKTRKLAREAWEKVLASLKEQLDTKVQLIEHAVEGVETAVATAENGLPPLACKDRDALPDDDLLGQMVECEAMVEAAREVAASVQQRIDAIPFGFDDKHEDAIKELLAPGMRVLTKRMGRYEKRLRRCENLMGRFRGEVAKRKTAENFKARCFAAKVLRQHARRSSLSTDELFREIDLNGDGKIDQQEFLRFFSIVDKNLEEEVPAVVEVEQLALEDADETEVLKEKEEKKDVLKAVALTSEVLTDLFQSLLAEGSENLSKDTLSQMMRSYYKVAHESIMTEDLQVTGENSIREVKVDEVLEVLEGPVRDEGMKVMRLKCRAIADDREGWLSIKGNKGTTYLEEQLALYRVVRDTKLTTSFEKEDSAEGRKLLGCEVIEVVEWPKKHEDSGLTRMKVQALNDGAVGWMTQAGKDGDIFAELL